MTLFVKQKKKHSVVDKQVIMFFCKNVNHTEDFFSFKSYGIVGTVLQI